MPRNENQGLGASIRVTTYSSDFSEAADKFIENVHASERCTCVGYNSKTCICLENPKDLPGFATPKHGMGKVLEHPLPLIQEHQDPSKWAPTHTCFTYGQDRDHRTFESGSVRDNDDDKPLVNHLDPYLRLRFGYLLRAGANKYSKGNWRLGQDTETALESLHRHLAKYELNLNSGIEQDEDHLMACIFNLQLIAKNEEKAGIPVNHYYGTTK